MSTKGPSQGRGGFQKGRQRWYKKQPKGPKSQDDVELPKKPPKRPHPSAGPPRPARANNAAPTQAAGPKKRRHDDSSAKAPDAVREVLNKAVVAGPPFRYVAQVGQGTYGKVYKAIDTTTQKVLAMKRLRLESQREGLPVTAAREIKLLQMLSHRNIVRLNEIVVSRNDIYMAFDYIEHDLAGLLLNHKLAVSPANVKSVIAQTTAALAFLHSRTIMHRDIKGSNILVTADGVIKLADFGLARSVDIVRPDARYTNRVITLWYRPPELLLGADRYGPEVDEWGIGCLLVELFLRAPLFHGKDEISQLQAIYDVLGVPSTDEWPGREQLPWFTLFDSLPMTVPTAPRTLPGVLAESNVPPGSVSPACLDLVSSLLAFNPAHRLSAEAALEHAYFREDPRPEPLKLALVDEWHDWEAKQRTRSGSSDPQHQQPSQQPSRQPSQQPLQEHSQQPSQQPSQLPPPQHRAQKQPQKQQSQQQSQPPRQQTYPRPKVHDFRRKN